MTTPIAAKERILGGLWGAVVGDALGVPVEFRSREELKADPVINMREYGTHHQPRGAWSDDSSLMLCTVESLVESNGYNAPQLAREFVRWYEEAHWTPQGRVFDVGIATRKAIANLARGVAPEEAGMSEASENGNGSLMRILPVGLYYRNAPLPELLDYTHRASCLTHRHLRSQMACGFYCAMAVALLEGMSPAKAYAKAIERVGPFYQQTPYSFELEQGHFERLFSGKIGELAEDEIKSGGYVIHTLEASLWCLLTTNSYREAVLKAVNLGSDTDTTAIVTGGLAGLYYGLVGVPADWLQVIIKREQIEALFEKFIQSLPEV